MLRFIQAALAALCLLLPPHAFAGPAEEASMVIDGWIAAFNENRAEGVASFYAPEALLHGSSSPKLYIGNEAIREYFKNFRNRARNARIAERHIVLLSESVVMAVGFYEFDISMNGQIVPRPARFTFVVAKYGSTWLIAHSSTVPPAPLQ